MTILNRLFLRKLTDKFFKFINQLFIFKILGYHNDKPKRILVIKLSAMGDALCLMPSLRIIKRKFPHSEVHWLTSYRSSPDLFKQVDFLDKIIVLPMGFRLIFSLFEIWRFKYDVCIDFDQSYHFSETISNFANFNIGFKSQIKGSSFNLSLPYHSELNEKLLFLELTKILLDEFQSDGIAFDYTVYEILNSFCPSSRLLNFASELSKYATPVLIIYPGSSQNAIYRRWPISKYIELANSFDSQVKVIFSGGVDEIPFKSSLLESGLANSDHINNWSLLEWAWIFKNVANLFVGNDAGLLHLAESQNLPVIGIFGPNIYSKWGSLNPLSICVDKVLDCRPCIQGSLGLIPTSCSRGDVACLDISVSKVRSHVFEALFVLK